MTEQVYDQREELYAALRRLDVIERKAFAKFLVIRAARAVVHRSELPWWAFLRRLRYGWTITFNVTTAAEVERGEHLDEQASWLNDIRDGAAILEGIQAAIARRVDPTPDLTTMSQAEAEARGFA